jgi:hypothetical protein
MAIAEHHDWMAAKRNVVLGQNGPAETQRAQAIADVAREILETESGQGARGGQVVGEHASIDTVSAIVRTRDLAALDRVLTLSADAVVRPHQLGLLGGVMRASSVAMP